MDFDLSVNIIGKLLLASALGGLIGLERALRHKAAGLRTNMFMCVGSALFTILSEEFGKRFGGDHARIAAQLIPGIGFIGAGAIIRDLNLRRPIYRKTAAYGHFGRTDIDAPWENTDKADELREAADLPSPK